MFKLALNLRATKRLYLHQVLNDENRLVYTSKHADDCFRWLVEHDQREIILTGIGCSWRVTIEPVVL